MPERNRSRIVGWVAVGLSTLITCFWAFWGAIENFHEGWYAASLPANLGLMLVQYLSPMLIFMGVSLISIRWPRLGGALHLFLAVLAAWFFQVLTNTVVILLLAPLIGIGTLYGLGRPEPRRIAVSLAVGLPMLTLILCGVGPAIRVSQRLDDGNLQARWVDGNGVALIWAPAGPGWPRTGTNWYEAARTCEHLSGDGLGIAPAPQSIWRLPAVDEAVRSMARHGQNSGGVWDAALGKAAYETRPDKESPLWDIHSQVIYWWTATEVDEGHAWIIVYDGKVWPRPKQFRAAYLGFRCVREP